MQVNIRFVPGTVVGAITYGKYYIDVFDDAGNPTNGNGILVQYQQVQQDNYGPIQTVIIPGQTVLIYDGIVQDTSGGDYSYLFFLLTSTGETSPELPPNPDLRIDSIEIVVKANTSGTGGTVQVNAFSSYPPIEYYLDDVLQGQNFFLCDAGIHTIKVIDATLTEVEQQFTMPQAQSILTSDPSVTVAGKVSRWNAAFNPVYFSFQRRDFDVMNITQDTETLYPKIQLNTIVATVAAGEYVYIEAGLVYKGVYKVAGISGNNSLLIDTDYVTPDSTTGFCNINALRPYYKVVIQVKYIDPATGLFKTTKSTNRPLFNGIINADISALLQSILKPLPDLSDYTDINYRDMGLAASYQVSYYEEWENSTPEVVEMDLPYYAVFAAKQLGEAYGGNLFDYVTQQGGTQLAKWLTDFKEPAYSRGYPFDLGFIYSEEVAGKELYAKIVQLDINKQQLGDEYTAFLLNEDGSYLLNEDGSRFLIAKQELVNMSIVERVGLNRLLINQSFDPLAYYVTVQLFYDDEETPIPVTEAITVVIDQSCERNPVYVRWIGLNGSWNYYRFNYNQMVTLDIQNSVIIKNFVSDWANQQGIEQVVSKEASEKMQVFADALTINDIKGLQSIKFSPVVQMLTDKNNLKWQTIIVNSTTYNEYETENEVYDFGFTFNMPGKNVQTN